MQQSFGRLIKATFVFMVAKLAEVCIFGQKGVSSKRGKKEREQVGGRFVTDGKGGHLIIDCSLLLTFLSYNFTEH